MEPKLVTDPRLAGLLAELVKREPHDAPWQTRDFHCREIAPDDYLLTYTLEQGPRVTRRMTVRRRSGADWKIVYHQGTIVEESR